MRQSEILLVQRPKREEQGRGCRVAALSGDENGLTAHSSQQENLLSPAQYCEDAIWSAAALLPLF
jgi:hypothetical protein